MSDLRGRIEEVLPLVSKPARYLGNELNVIRKNHSLMKTKLVLAFPDVYEIGQSYTGFHILYHVVNRRPDVVAERTFAPWPDMERLMRQKAIPLFSLESATPLRDFDALGFTLQHELNYTNVLNMLDMAGIPLWAKQRGEQDPLVLGGGPCAFNPEPLADFFDAFVIGDGEEVIGEIIDSLETTKGAGRPERLKQLAAIEGVYVPSLYRADYNNEGSFKGIFPIVPAAPEQISARVADLKNENYPSRPLVPLTQITHDRLSVEIMRGCTRGCRFCSAGMTYRPVRERPVADLVEQIRQGIDASGWEEVSLLSLSTSDYGGLEELLSQLSSLLVSRKLTLSLPSIRMDNFTLKLAQSIQGIRKAGLTFAPEAGTQRLREVINKNLDEKELLETIKTAYSAGWGAVKLYFMIGLPTETYEDLDGIVELVRKIVYIGRRHRGKGLHLSISPFSPKPHTPFQWDAQDNLEQLRKKSYYLRDRIRWKNVRLKWREPEVSFIEAVFARGGRRMSQVLWEAWKHGAKFDAWTDSFDFQRWMEAFQKAGIDPRREVEARPFDAPLPWDHISPGVTKEFLKKEREKASIPEQTPDCRTGCVGCGLPIQLREKQRLVSTSQGTTESPGTREQAKEAALFGRRRKRKTSFVQVAKTRVRLKYAKRQQLKFLGHLDLVEVFHRAVRMAQIPIDYSRGFHPRPKISFGPPLSLGITSSAEYVDLQFERPFLESVKDELSLILPTGLDILEERPIFGKAESLNKIIKLAEYTVKIGAEMDIEELKQAIKKFESAEILCFQRERRGTVKEVNIKAGTKGISLLFSPAGIPMLRMLLLTGSDNDVRPTEVLKSLLGWPWERVFSLDISRTALYANRNGELISPMEVI